jgi:hypothetical protein
MGADTGGTQPVKTDFYPGDTQPNRRSALVQSCGVGCQHLEKQCAAGAPLDHITAEMKTFGPVQQRRGEVDGTRTRDPRRDRPIL